MSILLQFLLFGIAASFVFACCAIYSNRPTPPAGPDPVVVLPRPGVQTLDLANELRATVDQLAPMIARQFAHICLVANPGETVRMDARVLRTALLETIASAVRAAPGSEVLVSALTFGPGINITVTDDGQVTSRTTREQAARVMSALLEPHGGTVVVEARPGHGTTVTVTLPLSANTPIRPVEKPLLADQAA